MESHWVKKSSVLQIIVGLFCSLQCIQWCSGVLSSLTNIHSQKKNVVLSFLIFHQMFQKANV